MSRRALILGVLGMDGSHLAELLHSKGYEVHGIVRETTVEDRMEWIKKLVPGISIYPINVLDKKQLRTIINTIRPSEIYNFAGVSNVFLAYENLDEIFHLNAGLPQSILEIIMSVDKSIRFFNASSCLIFGKNIYNKQNEQTPVNPMYPYGAAKAYANNLVRLFRQDLGIFACSGIFYPHESERRGAGFFTKKITSAVARILDGKQDTVEVGGLAAFRDMGAAQDYVRAAHLMMIANEPTDYVIGTGKLISMIEFTQECFDYAGLDINKHVVVNELLTRKNDVGVLCADYNKVKRELGWERTITMKNLIKKMIDAERTV